MESPVDAAHESSPLVTTLLFDTDGGRTISPPLRREIGLTAPLARAFVRAARVNAGRSTTEPPLSFSSLLVAMMVDEDTWLREHFEAQEVRFDQIAERRRYDEASLRDAQPHELAGEYLTTVSARGALEEAARIATLASGTTLIDLRHLCAAYPVLQNWHLEDFEAFNIDRLVWARAWGAEMARRVPAERRFWSSYADRASPVPLTSFSADVYTEEDLLGIDRGVDALALLVASTRTVTPLAIGVFGPWGSGKSFFMRHLQKRIVGLRQAEEGRVRAWVSGRAGGTAQAADAPLYFGEIAQVEFNAWHYNEGNLVASLVEHLFRNLRVLPSEGEDELARRRTEMLRQLNALEGDLATVGETIGAAERGVAQAKADVEQANRAADQARSDVQQTADEIERQNRDWAAERRRLDEAILALEPAAGEVDPQAALAVALGPLAPLLGEVRRAITQVRNQAFDWRDWAARVFSAKGLVVVALCAIAPAVLWLTQVLEGQWAALMASVAAAAGGFGSALDVIKARRAEFEAQLQRLEDEQARQLAEARVRIEDQRDEIKRQAVERIAQRREALEAQRQAQSAKEEQLAKAAQRLAAQVREHEARLGERAMAEAKVRAAEAELKRLSSALLLEEFIKDRLSTDEYRKELGFLALVRRDIDRLSHLIDQANRQWLDARSKDPPPLLNRIVLYIDDLDRCSEKTVLAVLEAVHLLLAFPLFVCAVAVDPRWVEHCLRAKHPQLFVDEDAPREAVPALRPMAPATVGDYLEKIFQIPIWMTPIPSGARAALVNALLGPTASPQPRRPGPAPAPATVDAGAAGAGEAPQGNAFGALVSRKREQPDPLQISDAEARFIGEIGPLLSDRPRALKRLVNVYRLLKASLPDIERASFVDEDPSSAYRVCLTQLALFTGHPRLAPALVAAVGMPSGDEVPARPWAVIDPGAPTLNSWFMSLPEPKDKDLAAAIELMPNSGALRVEAFRHWLPQTSRYLFHRAG